MTSPSTRAVLFDVSDERARQEAKWGQQNHPDIYLSLSYPIESSDEAKALTDVRAKVGQISYADILLEEVAEAVDAARMRMHHGSPDTVTALRGELVQVAAVAVAWVEKLDRQAGQ